MAARRDARGRFILSASIERDLSKSTDLRSGVVEVAREIAEKARALAPFDRIAAEIEVDEDSGDGAARVNATDWISHFWEFGTINHEARPFLRPAAESSASRFRGR